MARPFNAEAAKFSLDRHRTMVGSFRKPELATVDHIDVVDPLTINIVLKIAIFSSDRSTDRPRRHDGVAEGGQG